MPLLESPRSEVRSLLLAEARRWIELGQGLGYFAAADVSLARLPPSEFEDVLDDGETPAISDAFVFANVLAEAQDDLTPERKEFLELVFFADEDAWRIRLERVRSIVRTLEGPERSETVEGVEGLGWALDGAVSHLSRRAEGFPARWRSSDLSALAAVRPLAAARVLDLNEARAAITEAVQWPPEAERPAPETQRAARCDARHPDGGLGFTEELRGWLSFEETDFNQALLAGRQARRTLKIHLKISIADLDRFLVCPHHPASAVGWVECGELGGRLTVEDGRFELFVQTPDAAHLRMRYRLFLRTPGGLPFTLVGFKLVENDLHSDHWVDVTTLFVRVYAGRVEADPPGGELGPSLVATGVVRVGLLAFLRQLSTYRADAGTRLARLREIARFQTFFLAKLALAYVGPPVHGLPSFPRDHPPEPPHPPPPAWEPVGGRPTLERRIVAHTTDDGVALKLDHLRRAGAPPPSRGPVLLSHGAGLRGQMFYGQPTGRTLADDLLDAGYDVWVQHWRGSIDLPTSSFTLEQVARYDHPSAVQTILEQTGASTLKAVVHCQGSVSFTMAAAAGLVPEVTEVVASGVSLHIQVPPRAREKHLTLPALTRLTPWIDAQWAIRPITSAGRALAMLGATTPIQQRLVGTLMHRLAALARRLNGAPAPPDQAPAVSRHPGYRGTAGPEHPVCQMANFMYGAGADVLWRGENVSREIHQWMGRELGSSPLSLFNQIRASTLRGHVAPSVQLPGMPSSYVAGRPRTAARFTFVVGDANRMFLPAGMRATFEYFDRHAPAGHHHFVELEGFGHLDLFFGREAPARMFPVVLAGLEPAPEAKGPAPGDQGQDDDDPDA